MSSKTKVLALTTIMGALGLAMVSTACLSSNNLTAILPAFAQQQKFTASMTGSEEVPPKNTQATGTAEFNLSVDGKNLSYEVSAMNLNHATMAHIHSGKVGVNGPVVLVIYDSNTRSGPMGPGILSQGNATSANLEGPLAGKQMSDLVNLIKSGEAYVNVHTVQNSKGEIRGQIS